MNIQLNGDFWTSPEFLLYINLYVTDRPSYSVYSDNRLSLNMGTWNAQFGHTNCVLILRDTFLGTAYLYIQDSAPAGSGLFKTVQSKLLLFLFAEQLCQLLNHFY